MSASDNGEPERSAAAEILTATLLQDDELECVDVNEIMALFGDWTLRLDVQVRKPMMLMGGEKGVTGSMDEENDALCGANIAYA